jgi:hypothetical protein
MALKLLQIDFPINGPWGIEMAGVYSEALTRITRGPLAD